MGVQSSEQRVEPALLVIFISQLAAGEDLGLSCLLRVRKVAHFYVLSNSEILFCEIYAYKE